MFYQFNYFLFELFWLWNLMIKWHHFQKAKIYFICTNKIIDEINFLLSYLLSIKVLLLDTAKLQQIVTRSIEWEQFFRGDDGNNQWRPTMPITKIVVIELNVLEENKQRPNVYSLFVGFNVYSSNVIKNLFYFQMLLILIFKSCKKCPVYFKVKVNIHQYLYLCVVLKGMYCAIRNRKFWKIFTS